MKSLSFLFTERDAVCYYCEYIKRNAGSIGGKYASDKNLSTGKL